MITSSCWRKWTETLLTENTVKNEGMLRGKRKSDQFVTSLKSLFSKEVYWFLIGFGSLNHLFAAKQRTGGHKAEEEFLWETDIRSVRRRRRRRGKKRRVDGCLYEPHKYSWLNRVAVRASKWDDGKRQVGIKVL